MKLSVPGCLVFVMLSLGLFIGREGHADVTAYRWVDDKGVMHFGDVPPSSAARTPVETLRMKDLRPVPTEEGDGRDFWQRLAKKDRPAPNPRRVQEASVELYTAAWCGYCRRAKAYLDGRGIEFTEYDVDRDKEAAVRRRNLAPGNGIPLAVINGSVIVGFNPARYERALARDTEP